MGPAHVLGYKLAVKAIMHGFLRLPVTHATVPVCKSHAVGPGTDT